MSSQEASVLSALLPRHALCNFSFPCLIRKALFAWAKTWTSEAFVTSGTLIDSFWFHIKKFHLSSSLWSCLPLTKDILLFVQACYCDNWHSLYELLSTSARLRVFISLLGLLSFNISNVSKTMLKTWNTPACCTILGHQQLQPEQFISRQGCRGLNWGGWGGNPVCSWNGCNALLSGWKASCVCTRLWLHSVSKGWLQRDGYLLRFLCAAKHAQHW